MCLIFKGVALQEEGTVCPLKMEQIGNPETSVYNHLTLRNNTEDGGIHYHDLLTPCIWITIVCSEQGHRISSRNPVPVTKGQTHEPDKRCENKYNQGV